MPDSNAEWVHSSPESQTTTDSRRRNFLSVLSERRRIALEEIDGAPFSWVHAKICFIAGAGFFTDAYDIFAIGIMTTMLGYVYGDENGSLTAWQSTGLKVATPLGNLIGQLVFGWLGDVLGRKRMYGIELIIMITATFGQALAAPGNAVDIIAVLVFWRVILGIGCGGDYPQSATIMSEFAPIRTRGRLITAVFAAQGWGQLAASIVGVIAVAAFKDAIINADYPCAMPVDYTWRILVGFGCIPGVIAFYYRLTIPETPRFTMDIQHDIARATRDIKNILSTEQHRGSPAVELDEQFIVAPRGSLRDFAKHFSEWKNLKVLIGTAYSWFALDIPFYGLSFNTSVVLTYSNFGHVSGSSSADVYQSLFRICTGSMVLAVAGYIPGFWASFFLIDSWGRKPLQLMGFTILTILFLIMGFAYTPLISTGAGQRAFIFLYCLANFFQNFGPNTTTFLVPSEVFPTRYRSTAYGISAACGKIGAVVAQLGLVQPLLNHSSDMKIILEVLSFVMFTGILSTLLIPETKNRTLEDLSNEYQETYITGPVGGPSQVQA